ncbi:hypothetical protein L7F22_041959, partial [Adiantum nelumboides]|nr:hypothetical protein [Adiantum nelumboides]
MEGQLHKNLTNKDLPPTKWLTFFKEQVKKKTKLHMVHNHLYNACRLLYQKLYQAAPSNDEIMIKFARGLPMRTVQWPKQILKAIRLHGHWLGGQKAEEDSSTKTLLAEKCNLWLHNEGSLRTNSCKLESLRVELHALKASSIENAALIVKKEAEIGVLTRVLSMNTGFNDTARMKEEVSAMQ